MKVTSEVKKEIFKEYGGAETNTGGSEAQVALFTKRIQYLTEHLKRNKKDFATERSLVKMVGKRRALLNYIANKDVLKYRELIKRVGIRK